jgi:hypothetical protein
VSILSKVRNRCSYIGVVAILNWNRASAAHKTDILSEMQTSLRCNQWDHKKPKLSDALSPSDGLSLDHAWPCIASPAACCVLSRRKRARISYLLVWFENNLRLDIVWKIKFYFQ